MPELTVVTWRRRRLLDAGFGWDLAEELAADPRTDLHALLQLLEGGCPPSLAARGASRFTTGAYKFAICQPAVSLRRRAWQEREVPLTPDAWAFVPDPAGRRSAPRPRSCSPPSRTASPH